MKQEYSVLTYFFFSVTQRWRILEETRCEVILIFFYLLQSSQLELHLHLHHCHFQHKLFSLLPRLATSLIQRSDILPTWILRILWRIMYLLTTHPVHRLARYCKTTWTLQKKSCVECVSFRVFRPISYYFWSQSKLTDGALFLFNMVEKREWDIHIYSLLLCQAQEKCLHWVTQQPVPVLHPSCRLGTSVARQQGVFLTGLTARTEVKLLLQDGVLHMLICTCTCMHTHRHTGIFTDQQLK